MKMQTSELQGAALDWAVTKANGGGWVGRKLSDGSIVTYSGRLHRPSWEECGPIIEREGLCLNYDPFSKRWNCSTKVLDSYQAETPLIAAMRCYVASELGPEMDVPEELK